MKNSFKNAQRREASSYPSGVRHRDKKNDSVQPLDSLVLLFHSTVWPVEAARAGKPANLLFVSPRAATSNPAPAQL